MVKSKIEREKLEINSKFRAMPDLLVIKKFAFGS